MIATALRALVLLAPMAAAAEPAALRGTDLDRIARFEEAAGGALLQAFAGGDADDLDALRTALRGAPIAPDPAGDWSCRTIKAGGALPVVAYTDFRCRITQQGPTEWRIEKLTGSQRLTGTIAFHEGRAIFRGVGFAGEVPATEYADLPEGRPIVEPHQTHPQVAVFEQVSPTRARLMFPYPILESDFDVLELTR